jgi:chromosome segregation ATPase
MEVEIIKKSQRETTLEIEILGKRSGDIDVSITRNTEDRRENFRCRKFHEKTLRKQRKKMQKKKKKKKILTQNLEDIPDTMRRQNLRVISIDEKENVQLKGPVNTLNKIIEDNFPNL